MNSWFFIALVSPLLFSLVNHTDKYILSRYAKNGGVGSIIIFSSLFTALALPIIFFFVPEVTQVTLPHKLILLSAGILYGIGFLCYLQALHSSHPSTVVPILQTIPIFGFIFGGIMLHETLSANQLLAAGIILFGSILISIEKKENGSSRFAHRAFILMLLTSCIYALYDTLFKYVAIQENFWASTFWQTFGITIFGAITFFVSRVYRNDFIKLIKTHDHKIVSLNIFAEIVNILGNFIFSYATLLAPLALVMSINGYQPVFVFIIGLCIAKYFPKIAHEDLNNLVIIRKCVSIGIILIGSYLMYL